ncbi:fungal-specific transcription factor domain-containing protein [Diplogelasinospora grovesii]|uniref:Fungal-specific transcription factor domain-containing protein n=1 Tax=Diplogelasinospora grovesii TaxID=303347 RepID=A0AAN6NGC6_9PEZI|nr:fungal-specific transcription factor domain-containing protein [Diplogelasinospora grovesii]
MPRPKRPGAPPPKQRSRTGCWICKRKKIKCDETHPTCSNCRKTDEACDYSIRLNWDGRRKKHPADATAKFSPHLQTTPRSASATLGSTPQPGFAVFSIRDHVAQRQQASPESPSLQSLGLVASAQIPRDHVSSVFLPGPSAGGPPGTEDPGIQGHGSFLAYGSGQPPIHSPIHSPDWAGALQFEFYQPPHMRRARYDGEALTLDSFSRLGASNSTSATGSTVATPRFQSVPSMLSMGSPDTPSSSSLPYSEDEYSSVKQENYAFTPSPKLARLSVHSLLPSPAVPSSPWNTGSPELGRGYVWPDTPPETSGLARRYGVDHGLHDPDFDNADDEQPISWASPVITGEFPEAMADADDKDKVPWDPASCERAPRDHDEDLPIVIPIELSPLPPKLRRNDWNMLYFNHFLHHTARVLVPHDDPQSNPFRTILPRMALRNENLMNLLLAYSAAHRARRLKYPEPKMRIALWVQDIMPALHKIVEQAMSSETSISSADIATAIMLASLEIVSPLALGTLPDKAERSIPWQMHLSLAREVLSHRPGGLRRRQSNDPEDQVCAFLWSWFAYLDVLGSLSGGRAYSSGERGQWILDYERDAGGEGCEEDDSGPDQIDCILGFTPRCVSLLAKIAGLANICHDQRIDPETRTVRPGWQPDAETESRALSLRDDVMNSLERPSFPCKHAHSSTNELARWDHHQMAATNEAYHWAALVHLDRRVLGRPSDHVEVQQAVAGVLGCLERIEPGGTAETNLLFPMFTAGCELANEAQRILILERIQTVEGTGMTQVSSARRLMEKVWERGQPWDTLLSTEFIG